MSKKILPPIHLATSDDELRPALQHIEIIDGVATATNAFIIAKLNLAAYSELDPETIKRLNGKLIHRDVWEAIMDATTIDVEDDTLHIEKGGIRADYDISCSLKFPDHDSIVKQVANSLFDKKSFVCSKQANSKKEKHICPLQIDIVKRLINRFTKPGELVDDPFGGLFTVPYVAMELNRQSISTELNSEYFRDGLYYVNAMNHKKNIPTLFDLV